MDHNGFYILHIFYDNPPVRPHPNYRYNLLLRCFQIAKSTIQIVYYSIGVTFMIISTLEFWRKISKSRGGALLISRKILMLVM